MWAAGLRRFCSVSWRAAQMTWLILVAASAFSSGAATAWERAIRPEMAACLGPLTAATSRRRQHHGPVHPGPESLSRPICGRRLQKGRAPGGTGPTPCGTCTGWTAGWDHLDALVYLDAAIHAARQAASGAAAQAEGTG